MSKCISYKPKQLILNHSSFILFLTIFLCCLLYILLSSAGWIQKDSNATDYSDISELAEEEEEKYYKRAVSIFSQKKNADSAGGFH